jgi:hypothetical protein
MKIKNIFIIIISVCVLQSCDSQLEIPQNDNITSENLYNTESGALAGLAGVYSRIVAVYREAIINAQYPTNFTDEGHYNRSGLKDIRKNNFTASEPKLNDIWAFYYEGIAAANSMILGLNNATLETEVKQVFLAEAYFLRALIYFDIQKTFGGIEGIPMPLEETANQLLPRTSGIDVYKKIVADLEFARDFLPEPEDVLLGRATKSAATGLLARAYLYMASAPFNESGAYEKARDYSLELINDSSHQLNPSYEDVFNQLAMGNYEQQEMLFQIAFSYKNLDINQSSKLGSEFGMKIDDEACGKGFALTYITVPLILKYRSDPTDERGLWNASPYFNVRNNNCELSTINNQFIYPASKYRRFLETNFTQTSFGPHHWPVIRMSEIHLIYAEAENKMNPNSSNALDAVNIVRNRAKATPLNAISDELIQDERLLELCFEGHRKYDLIRWNKLEDKVTETRIAMENYASDANFTNQDWFIYGEPNLGPDGIPQSGDEPAILQTRRNTPNTAFTYFDGYNDFDINKHYILPIPEQELGANTNLKQNSGW